MSKPNAKKTLAICVVWLAVCIIIGALLAARLFVMEARGYFKQWHKLAIAPSAAVELLSDKTGAIYVKTSSNETYHLEWREGNEYWSKEVSQNTTETRSVEVTKPCDFSSPEFSLFTNTPKNIIDCVQTVEPQTDGFMRYAYVLDKDDTVWHWYTGASADPAMLVLLACVAALGAVAGLFFGGGTSLVGILITNIKRKSGPTPAGADSAFVRSPALRAGRIAAFWDLLVDLSRVVAHPTRHCGSDVLSLVK